MVRSAQLRPFLLQFVVENLTGLLPASPVRKGGVKGSYTKMAIFAPRKPRPEGRGGFTDS